MSVDLAWAAGFFDGEGCSTRTGHRGGSVRPRLSISQVEREPLERFMAAVGGQGTITAHGQRDILRWSTNSAIEAWAVLALLWPFLSTPKREQAFGVLQDHIVSKAGEFARRSAGRRKRVGYALYGASIT